MVSRADRRAAARAGRSCPVCGGPIDARRSTAVYCSTRCRVKAHRPSLKEGLRPGQVRILEVLAAIKAHCCLPRLEIAERADMSDSHLPDLIGQHDPDRRAAAQARTGIVSLLDLGYVSEEVIETDWRKERCYRITQTGREALDALGHIIDVPETPFEESRPVVSLKGCLPEGFGKPVDL